MDLLTLAAKITLDDSSYTKGIKNAESMGQQLQSRMSAMTVAVGNIAADVIRKSVSAIGGVINGAIDGYADYQQLIGGVETLFKTSAGKVQKYAEQSYKTTGLSANAYMETVTSFSASLLQGLGGNTEAAAEIANTAVQDMADNANKMGTDIGSIQNAYMGFAKQNYTMLDNLKLGYGGTASEMIRLINDSGILEDEIKDLDGITFDQLVEAIHVIQTEMGITGTTAKEAAETISGSKASLQAAWADFLTSVGGEQDQQKLEEASGRFQETFKTYVVNNLLPAITTTFENTPELISAVSGAISDLPSKAVSDLVGSGVNIFTAGVEGATSITSWLIGGLVTTFKGISADPSKVTELGNAIGEFIGSTVSQIGENLPAIVSGMFTFGVSLAGGILEGIWSGLFGSEAGGELERINTELENSISTAEISSTRAQAILNYMSDLHKEYGDAVTETEAWQTAENELEKVLGGSKQTFEEYGTNVQGAITELQSMAEELRKLAIEQALQDKLNAQYKLLGEYELQRTTAEVEASLAQNNISALDQRYAESAKAYARELIRGGYLEEGSSEWYTAKNTLETPGYAGTGLNVLVDQLEEMYERNGTKESDWIWNKSEIDDILSPETLSGLNTEYELQQQALESANKSLEEAQSGIDQTNQQIYITMAAIQRTSDQLNSLSSAANQAGGALEGLTGPNIGYMPRAVGIDYVPTDGFRAELHRGEAILTASENAKRRSGANADEFAEIMESALITAMNRVNVYMSGEKVGDLTTKRVRNNINSTNRARTRSMGG